MRSAHLFAALALCASYACAQNPRPYQTGKLSHADPACVSQGKSRDSLCQQYILEADGVVFRIRPKHQKYAISQVDRDRVEFRIQNRNILLRAEGVGKTEREYIVMSIAPLSVNSAADARPIRLNHLQ